MDLISDQKAVKYFQPAGPFVYLWVLEYILILMNFYASSGLSPLVGNKTIKNQLHTSQIGLILSRV